MQGTGAANLDEAARPRAGVAAAPDVVPGRTDNHLLLVDLTNENVTGKVAARALRKLSRKFPAAGIG